MINETSTGAAPEPKLRFQNSTVRADFGHPLHGTDLEPVVDILRQALFTTRHQALEDIMSSQSPRVRELLEADLKSMHAAESAYSRIEGILIEYHKNAQKLRKDAIERVLPKKIIDAEEIVDDGSLVKIGQNLYAKQSVKDASDSLSMILHTHIFKGTSALAIVFVNHSLPTEESISSENATFDGTAAGAMRRDIKFNLKDFANNLYLAGEFILKDVDRRTTMPAIDLFNSHLDDPAFQPYIDWVETQSLAIFPMIDEEGFKIGGFVVFIDTYKLHLPEVREALERATDLARVAGEQFKKIANRYGDDRAEIDPFGSLAGF